MTRFTKLTNRTVISITGDDSSDFLQGLITNDIYKVVDDTMIYSCFLTPQGKFLFDFFIVKTDGGYLLDVEAGRHKEFLMRLMIYKLRSDVTINDLSEQYNIYGAWGEGASGGYTDPRQDGLGQRFILAQGDDLPEGEQVAFDVYDHHRLNLGAPDGARDMTPERSGMLESNMDHMSALDWDKGCYMGQELTARTYYRGLVKRRLISFTYTGDAPEFGTVIRYQDIKIGDIRSTCNGLGLASVKCVEAQASIDSGDVVLADDQEIYLVNQSAL